MPGDNTDKMHQCKASHEAPKLISMGNSTMFAACLLVPAAETTQSRTGQEEKAPKDPKDSHKVEKLRLLLGLSHSYSKKAPSLMVVPFNISLPSEVKETKPLKSHKLFEEAKMEVTCDITKFYSFKISSDIILVKPHKTSQGKEGRPTHVCSTAIY